MVADANKELSKNEQEVEPSLEWYGLQFICKARGSQEILQRSFPFWAPSVDFAIDHAKKSNKLAKEERTYWTHVVCHSRILETKAGSLNLVVDVKEVKI